MSHTGSACIIIIILYILHTNYQLQPAAITKKATMIRVAGTASRKTSCSAISVRYFLFFYDLFQGKCSLFLFGMAGPELVVLSPLL